MLRDSGAASLTVGCCGFKGQWDTTVQLMGLDEICSRMGASLICVQEGENYHKYTLQRLDQYMSLFGTKVSDYVLKAEAVINLPKMKVHSMATVTGAIKNMMGVISPKGSMHPNGSSDILHKRLADLFELMNPIVTWSLMDGIVGSEYNEQYGVPKRANVLIAGNNMWSVDCLAAKVMGFSPAKIPYLRYIGNIHDWGYPQLDPAIPVTPFELPLYMRNLY